MSAFLDAPAHVQRFIDDALVEEPKPVNLRERNWRQVLLAERVQRQYNVDPIDALVWVAGPYAKRFPH